MRRHTSRAPSSGEDGTAIRRQASHSQGQNRRGGSVGGTKKGKSTGKKPSRLTTFGAVMCLLLVIRNTLTLLRLAPPVSPAVSQDPPDDTDPGGGALVLSYSLYGNQKRYLDGMYTVALRAPEIFPGWTVRVYHGPSVPGNFLAALIKFGHVQLVNVAKELPGWVIRDVNPMAWRFLVASDPTVRAYAIRDADSVPSMRERAAVDEWLGSGRAFHIMRDHPLHHPSVFAPILGGMWGGLNRAVPQMTALVRDYYGTKRKAVYGEDQDFLTARILPLAANDVVQHDSYYCKESGGMAFPMTRVQANAPFDFVGDLFTFVQGDKPKGKLFSTQKCMLVERNRARYNYCLKLRQDRETFAEELFSGPRKHILPDTAYTGDMRPKKGVFNRTEMCDPTLDASDVLSHYHFGSPANWNRWKGKERSSSSYTLWSSDFHISPIADVKDLFQSWEKTKDYEIIDESLSGHCPLKGTCAKDLKVINMRNGMNLGPCPNELKREFWREYARDERMNTVDAFLCHHVTGMCELFMAFGRPMIVVVSTRYEIARRSKAAWERLNDNLRAIAANPRNTIAANNYYDVEYVKHFTGLTDVKLLPNYCGYTGAIYKPTRRQVLVGPGRLPPKIQQLIVGKYGIKEAANKSAVLDGSKFQDFEWIKELYPQYEYSDLAAHPAIVLIPYQVSVMSMFEYYRMGIPMFAPSPRLLAWWQFKERIMGELTWNCVYGMCEEKSAISAHPTSPHGTRDPNDMTDADNVKYWIQFSDFYQWPGVIQYDNWEDLFRKLVSIDLNAIHKQMMNYNEQQKKTLQKDWSDILDKAFSGVPPRWSSKTALADSEAQLSWEEAVLRNYPQIQKHVNVTC